MAALQNAVDNMSLKEKEEASAVSTESPGNNVPNLAQSSDEEQSEGSSPKVTPPASPTASNAVTSNNKDAKMLSEEELQRKRKQEVLERKRAEVRASEFFISSRFC